MSLISERERAELEKLSCKELEERGFKKLYDLKGGLKKEIFYILAKNPPMRAIEILKEKGINYSINTLRSYRAALISNNLVKKTKAEREEEFLKFLRENPKVTTEDIIEAGYGSVLSYCYKWRINLAKEKAGVPEEYRYKKGFQIDRKKLKDLIYGLILSSIKPLYPNEIAEIVKRSERYVRNRLTELYAEGKIEYKNLLSGIVRSARYGNYDLFGESWKKFGMKKLAYIPDDMNHLEFIAKEISDDIVRSLGRKITMGKRIALTHRLKSFPENLRNLIEKYLPY